MMLAAVFAALVWLAYHYLHRPVLMANLSVDVPSLAGSTLLATLVGFGLAFLIGLAFLNRRRWRAALRPSPGKVLTAILMAGQTPLPVTSWMPWLAWVLFGMGLA